MWSEGDRKGRCMWGGGCKLVRAKSTQGLAHSRHSAGVAEEMCSVCRTRGLLEWSFFSWETRWTVTRSGRCPPRLGSNWPR